ncbi:transcription initiation factor TFIID subunit 5 [Tremella mesenterica]|uniref:Transcription initiation factor TFIID subunit 5 n=1 Tax=Tremella mesenterica TaxID=5217 RepID=A0A4Q1BQX9_TREME|nr:transcription initiation factor TFIID subunit 5 [Tremella mesenterica]
MDQQEPGASSSDHATSSRADPNLLRHFVMGYLQQHGFDKVLATFKANLPDERDVDGSEDARQDREAVVRAPGPVPIESALKRNIPQAQAVSASALSDLITPEFEAQARYIVEQMQKKFGAAAQGEGDDDVAVNQESLLDPSDRSEGYKRFRRWVDRGLEMWRVELDALSYPIFIHTYLDLMSFGFTRAAREFFDKHSSAHQPQHPQDIATLSSIKNRQHLSSNPFCQRLLNEKYTITMSRNPHDLVLQWLSGAGLDDEWESGLQTPSGRAKEAVKGIIFSRITLKVSEQSTPLDKITIASSSGLLASVIPSTSSVETFNNTGKLKLGPAPMREKLKEQVIRTLQDDDLRTNGVNVEWNGHMNGDVEMHSGDETPRPMVVHEIKIEPDVDPELISPEEGETVPPLPAVFRIADLKREVEAVRDRRKMIRLGTDPNAAGPSTPILPSIVAFTLFDNGEGASSIEFSPDSSLMAAGSPESCIRLWNLKGEKLKAKSVDPLSGSLVEDEGLPMRKLIGHSGPVYSLSFDPLNGSASSPSSLLSASQDGTVRLWSLDTYTNLVAYRGHGRDPVWDVEWGPMGVYFATASRDRTARLWCSDRVSPVRMYTGHLSDVNCVKFHPNSLYLSTGSNDASCRLWDVQRGACIRLFLGHVDAVTTLAISPDGKMLASAGLDSNIWLWDLGSSRPIKTMTGHRGPISSLTFSSESSMLVSGSLDCTVRCWDVKSAGGERGSNARTDDGTRRESGNGLDGLGLERGELPMGQGEIEWDNVPQT